MKSHSDIIDLWPAPSIRSFADDIGVKYVTAQLMRFRSSISSDHWDAVVKAAERRGFDEVTLELLSALKRKNQASGKRHPKTRARYQPAA